MTDKWVTERVSTDSSIRLSDYQMLELPATLHHRLLDSIGFNMNDCSAWPCKFYSTTLHSYIDYCIHYSCSILVPMTSKQTARTQKV